MNRTEFSKKASAAIKQGSMSRNALAEHHAKRFMSGAHDFDPKALTKLGNSGMRRFIRLVQDSGTAVEYPEAKTPEPEASPTPAVETLTKGWVGQRRPEPKWLLRAFIHGALIGTATFLCGLFALPFLPL